MALKAEQFSIRHLLIIMTVIGGILGFGLWFFRAAQNADSTGIQSATEGFIDAKKHVMSKMPGEKAPRKPRKAKDKEPPYKQLVQ